MRDPDRIPRVLKELETLWRLYPDQRLGQLILNIARDPDTGEIRDPWWFEDDHWEDLIRKESDARSK